MQSRNWNNEKHKKMEFLCSSRKHRSIFRHAKHIEFLNIWNINCNTIDTDKEGKGSKCNMRIVNILDAGSEQCCANRGPERSCTKTDSNTSCYTNSGSNSNLTINQMMFSSRWLTIMKLNISFQAQAKRLTKKLALKYQKQVQKEFEDVFNGIGCFGGTFSLQVKLDSKPYQDPPWHIAYALQKPFEELEDFTNRI